MVAPLHATVTVGGGRGSDRDSDRSGGDVKISEEAELDGVGGESGIYYPCIRERPKKM